MSEKHYPYIGGSFDRIVFDGDGSVWVPEPENAKLREQVLQLQLDWEGERDYADQMEAKEKKAVAENDKLREICASLFRLANNECLSGKRHCDDCPMSRNESPCVLSLDFIAMLGLGIDVTPWDVERIEVE